MMVVLAAIHIAREGWGCILAVDRMFPPSGVFTGEIDEE